MAFDAGAIVARVEIDEAAFNRSLDRVEARVAAFTSKDHHIKIIADLDTSSMDKVRQAFRTLDAAVTRDMTQRERTGAGGSIFGTLNSVFSRGAAQQAQQQAQAQQASIFRRILSAAGPGLNTGGISARAGLIGTGVALGGAALPALLGGVAPLAVGGLGLGVAGIIGRSVAAPAIGLAQQQAQAQAALARATTPAQRQAAQAQLQSVNQQLAQQPRAMQQIFGSITQIQHAWQNFTKSLAPTLVQPLHLIASTITSLLPLIRQVFGGAMTLVAPFIRGISDIAHMVLPLLNQAFRAAAPSIRPLLDGLGALLRGILPGLISLLKAAHPAVVVLAQVLGMLGRDLGSMFKDLIPALNASGVVLKAVFGVVGGLLPVIAKLAEIFAKALAPVIGAFAKALQSLTPALIIVGKLLGDLAGAVLMDLVGVLVAVAKFVGAIAPGLAVLARALSNVFTVLENTGLFGVLANVLEKVAGPLGHMISLLLVHLVPILPPLVNLLGKVAEIFVNGLAKALIILIPPLTRLVLAILTPLLGLLPKIIPLLTSLATFFSAALVRVVTDLATALAAVISAIPPSVLDAIALGFLAIFAAIKIMSGVSALIGLVSNPVFLIIAAVALLVVGIVELVKHWKQVWTDIKNWARDAWEFLTHGWGQWLVPGLTLIRLAVGFVRDHWRQAWHDIQAVTLAVWHFIDNDIFHPIQRLFTRDLPGWINTAVDWWDKHLWTPFKNLAMGAWHWIQTNVTNPIHDLFTKTIGGWFDTAVSIIGKAWGVVQDTVRKPVAWVVDNVVNGLINAYDWVASRVSAPQIPKDYHPFGLQTGGRIPGFGGGDRHVALLEGGEAVVSKETTAAHAAELSAWGVPGFQQGGLAGAHAGGHTPQQIRSGQAHPGSLFHDIAAIGRAALAVATGNRVALTNAMMSLFPHGVGGAGADLATMLATIPAHLLSAAVAKLLSFGGGSGWPFRPKSLSQLRRVDEGQDMQYPGTSPTFVYAILPGKVTSHGPDPGGFGSIYPGQVLDAPYKGFRELYYGHILPAGKGGHANIGDVIGRTMGPTSGGDAAGLSNWLEVGFWPPNYANGPAMHNLLIHGTGGPGSQRGGSWTVGGMSNLWRQVGGPGAVAHLMGAIGMAESGGRAWIVNSIGASGLWQILMPANAGYVHGDVLNPYVNARAALAIYRAQGLNAWQAYTNGSYAQFLDSGGWLMPGASVAMNQTGMREAVLTPRESQAFTMMARAAHEMTSGRSGGARRGSQVAEVMNIMLPEGTTLAAMMSELVFRLKAAELSGTAGAIR